MSVVLPVDTPPEPRKQPWVLHILQVNTMNFCSFAQADGKAISTSESEPENELLVAVPNTMSSETVISLYLSPLFKYLITPRLISSSFPLPNESTQFPATARSKAVW